MFYHVENALRMTYEYGPCELRKVTSFFLFVTCLAALFGCAIAGDTRKDIDYSLLAQNFQSTPRYGMICLEDMQGC